MGEHRQWRQGLPRISRPAWLHRPQWNRVEWTVWLTFAAFALAVFGVALALVSLSQANHRADVKTAQANAAVGAATSANASLSAAGLPTIQVPTSAAAPTSTVTVTGPAGEQGPGPSTAQVSAAVVTFCEEHTCSSPPSSSDVASAVAEYCTAHAGCAGPAGAKGDNGQNATSDQIASAVQQYCSANSNCQGSQGPAGAQGPQGASGPEIPSFTFTVTDELGRSTTYVCDAPTYACVAQ